jgi:K(+)-stimulated pyrophosphate-energized sodium pump
VPLAVATPIIVGVVLGYEAVAGFLMIGTISGVMLATVLNNSGGAWDNAKKYIESGQLKDAAGTSSARRRMPTRQPSSATPSVIRSRTRPAPPLHVLVKLIATIALVLAPVFVR